MEQAGWGLGYTNPARLPWLRLDRVLLRPDLEAVSFHVLGHHASAHRGGDPEEGRHAGPRRPVSIHCALHGNAQ
ncbi:MAG TPA: hypothetical protein VFE90_05260 [Myxococcales bacterium]|nr:hypothetical protein [Myxococcales bacterium]